MSKIEYLWLCHQSSEVLFKSAVFCGDIFVKKTLCLQMDLQRPLSWDALLIHPRFCGQKKVSHKYNFFVLLHMMMMMMMMRIEQQIKNWRNENSRAKMFNMWEKSCWCWFLVVILKKKKVSSFHTCLLLLLTKTWNLGTTLTFFNQ